MTHFSLATQLALGLLVGILGYPLFGILYAVLCGVIGIGLGTIAAGYAGLPWMRIVLPLVGAFLGVVIGRASLVAGLFVVGGSIGWAIGIFIVSLIGVGSTGVWIIGGILAIGGGLLMAAARKPLILLGTALAGARLVTGALFQTVFPATPVGGVLPGRPFLPERVFDPMAWRMVNVGVFIAVWIVLFLVFAAVQTHINRTDRFSGWDASALLSRGKKAE